MQNQLGIIVGFSEVLLNEMNAADRHRPDVDEINTAAKRALELLSSLPLPEEPSDS
jgi:hypothetical protein